MARCSSEPRPCVTHPCGQRVAQVEEELGRGEVAEHGACRGTRTERWVLTAAAPTPVPIPIPTPLTAALPPLASGLSSPRHASGRGSGSGP